MLRDPTYVRDPEGSDSQTRGSRRVTAKAWWSGGEGGAVFRGDELQLGQRQSSGRGRCAGLHNNVNVLSAADLRA